MIRADAEAGRFAESFTYQLTTSPLHAGTNDDWWQATNATRTRVLAVLERHGLQNALPRADSIVLQLPSAIDPERMRLLNDDLLRASLPCFTYVRDYPQKHLS